MTVIREVNGRVLTSQMPMHGSNKEVGTGLFHTIKKQLELN